MLRRDGSRTGGLGGDAVERQEPVLPDRVQEGAAVVRPILALADDLEPVAVDEFPIRRQLRGRHAFPHDGGGPVLVDGLATHAGRV